MEIYQGNNAVYRFIENVLQVCREAMKKYFEKKIYH